MIDYCIDHRLIQDQQTNNHIRHVFPSKKSCWAYRRPLTCAISVSKSSTTNETTICPRPSPSRPGILYGISRKLLWRTRVTADLKFICQAHPLQKKKRYAKTTSEVSNRKNRSRPMRKKPFRNKP